MMAPYATHMLRTIVLEGTKQAVFTVLLCDYVIKGHCPITERFQVSSGNCPIIERFQVCSGHSPIIERFQVSSGHCPISERFQVITRGCSALAGMRADYSRSLSESCPDARMDGHSCSDTSGQQPAGWGLD